LKDCSFNRIKSKKEKGKILSVDDYFSFVSVVNVSIDGGWREEENERRKNGREENEVRGEFCDWDSSLLHFSSSFLSSLELITIVNSREGGISIEERGRVQIIDGMFENNTAESIKYPSFRHNILCLNGELNIESLKGGDGLKENSSLFLSSPSSDCTLKKKEEEIFIPLFIPLLSSIDPPDKTNGMKITLNGNSLFPCSLSFSLFIDSSSSPISFSSSSLSCDNENKCIGEITESEIEERIRGYSILYVCLDYLDNKGGVISTERRIVENKEGPKSEGGNGGILL
jgi:hypothetical protein